MTQPLYSKLTGRRRTLLGYTQLWLGESHLLLVRSARFVEHYQRFSLGDIQAIVISDGPDFRAIQIVGAIASLGWTALALAVSSTFGRSFFLVTGLAALLFAIIDIARGPRCRCVLHTAVSRELLSPVHRRNSSRKFLAEVLPAIEALQGTLTPEQLQAVGVHSLVAAEQPRPPEVKRARSYAAEILFGLLVIDAGLVWVALRTSIPNVAGLLPTVYLAELILAGVMLAQRRAVKAGLLIWGILTLIFVVADISTLSGIAAWGAFLNSTRARTNPDDIGQALDSLWLSARNTAILATAGRLAAGAVGLVLCYLDRRGSREGQRE